MDKGELLRLSAIVEGEYERIRNAAHGADGEYLQVLISDADAMLALAGELGVNAQSERIANLLADMREQAARCA